MKIAQFSTFGRPEAVVDCVEAADPPAPQAGEVGLTVLAFPINPADLLGIEGRYASLPTLPAIPGAECVARVRALGDRKSTRLNSSHVEISYAVFCLKKKKNINITTLLSKKKIDE